ncbi:MAG: hypothetical protein A2W90_23255 [Bacteroidetes bacterium GWF2_42_66]|nr:MAG: hypothetical protein A2W92_03065 [Bacteroidetes bacterium GWA2_42_15]OFY00381.1 MAG: hypothetical protein A2W89_14410 [Bacteroidetes bacterium GWE2_42_39]OFY47049.1 MAG: hypothetical protein A2W90_23255 [Bacteroidetes bacterium GWF2_42_66]HAZ04320.1 RagB/SusD family nutrient uptake outer membrane protein [Marinilabiliales bacterium]HBL76786.1 RagB/SusD family nutrient uptake outer membrane protein [Prolixibacteraceae bacterium]
MKIQRYLCYILLITALLCSSCEEVLDTKIDANYSAEDVWKDRDFTMGILADGYDNLPTFYNVFSGAFLDCATDNAVTSDYTSSIIDFAGGSWNSESSVLDSWEDCYTQIRNMNLFLEKAPDVEFSVKPNTNEVIRKRVKGEALFLRAYYESELLFRFSGMTADNKLMGFPIVTEVLPEGVNNLVARSEFDACVDQIYNDIDNALLYLPEKYAGNDPELGTSKIGRATIPIALCLKSRVALYAASPIYTVNKNDEQKKLLWEKAATAAMNAINATGTSLPDLSAAMYENPDHAEIIWRSFQGATNTPEKNNFIPQLMGKGYTNPSQQLVDAFPAKTGYPITDQRSGYDQNAPYSNRDTRFSLSILYNGATFSGKTVEVFAGGLDNELSRSTATRTGYYLRKFLSESVTFVPGVAATTAKHYYALFRKAEIWLNYAEAANEAWGPSSDPKGLGKDALTTLKAIRKRGGIPVADPYATEQALAGKETFRSLIQNERRIELCFENQRFFDIRRWALPLNSLNEPVKGVTVTKNGSTFTYNFGVNIENRNFKDYMYYGPIPASEIQSANGIVKQNKGW